MNANSLKKIEWTGRHQSIPTPNPVPHLPSYQNHKFFPEWSCDIVQTNECEQVLLGMVSRKVTVFLTKRTRISTYHAHASLCSLLVSCLKCRVRSRTTAAIPPPWQQKLPTKDGEAEGETSGSLNKGATQHLVSSLHMTGINNNYTQLILREMQPRAEHSRDTSHSGEALRRWGEGYWLWRETGACAAAALPPAGCGMSVDSLNGSDWASVQTGGDEQHRWPGSGTKSKVICTE